MHVWNIFVHLWKLYKIVKIAIIKTEDYLMIIHLHLSATDVWLKLFNAQTAQKSQTYQYWFQKE